MARSDFQCLANQHSHRSKTTPNSRSVLSRQLRKLAPTKPKKGPRELSRKLCLQNGLLRQTSSQTLHQRRYGAKDFLRFIDPVFSADVHGWVAPCLLHREKIAADI